MLDIKQEDLGNGRVVLKLQGELTVEYVGQLREALLERMMEQEDLLVNCDQVTAIDTFGFQLLCSAHRTSVAWKKRMSWQNGIPAVLAEAGEVVGFARYHACDLCPEGQCCLWV